MTTPEFETERLILREMTEKDLDDLHTGCYADPDVTTFLHRKTSTTPEDTQIVLNDIMSFYSKNGFGFMSVIEKSSEEFIGVAGLNKLNNSGEYEVGYVFRKKSWGKGFATECTKFFTNYAFTNLLIQYLLAITHPDNKASQRVLLKQGFQYFDNRFEKGMDCSCFKITKEAWASITAKETI